MRRRQLQDVLIEWNVVVISMVVEACHHLVVVALEQTAKWQSVEQSVEPVLPRVVDVRVLTDELTQHRRVRHSFVVVVQLVETVQRHQDDQSLLSLHRHVVVVRHLELSHAERTGNNTRSSSYDVAAFALTISRYIGMVW